MNQQSESTLSPVNLSDLQTEFIRLKRNYPTPFVRGFTDHWEFLEGKTNNVMNPYGNNKPIANMIWAEGARIAAKIHASRDFSQIPSPDDLLTQEPVKFEQSKRVTAIGRIRNGGPIQLVRSVGNEIVIMPGVR